jgi:hypothetical protein
MDKFKIIIDKAKELREQYEKTTGNSPTIVVMNWDTYETIAQHDYCRTLCGIPIRVDPFCMDNTIIYLNE